MAEKKVIELEVKTNAQSLKAQLKEAQQEVQKLSEKYGETSREAVNAAKKAAELTDAIADAKALTDAFNPDAKFTALSGALSGVASGFAAVEGGMGLIGVESKAVQEQLLKVQSAMALAQGIDGVTDSVQAFKNLGAMIGQTAIGQKILTAAQIVGATTMRVLNAVMAANPILLVVTAVGALVGALELLKRGQDDAANKQRELNRQLEYTKRLEKESIDATSEHVNELKKQHDNKLRLKQAEGVADNVLAQMEIDNKKEILRYYNLVYKGGAKLNKDQLADAKQLREDLKVLEAQKITDLKESNVENKKANVDRGAELERQRQEAKANLEAGKLETIEQLQAIENAENEYYKSKKTARQQDLDDVNNKFFQLIEAATKNNVDTKVLLEAQLKEEQIIKDKYKKEAQDKEGQDLYNYYQGVINTNKKVREDDKLTADTKWKLVRESLNVIGDLATSFAGKSEAQQKRAFEIQKAANIAGGLMDTFKASLGALKDTPGGPILRGIAAGLTATAGLAMVNNIRKQEFRGGSTGSIPPISEGGGGGQANQVITPNFNIIGAQNQTQLAQLNQAPIKAYVVGSDVTTQQMLDKKKIQNATL